MIKKILRVFSGLMAAACGLACLGVVGTIDGGAALSTAAPAAFALIGGTGLFAGLAYLLG